MKVLAIETSCDETAAAVVERRDRQMAVLSNIVASQIDIHAKTGGVVPEVASREHIRQAIPVIDEAVAKAEVALKDLDAIAVTSGPGLIPALLIGVETARTLAASLGLPLIPVNHIDGHIAVNWLTHGDIALPAVALVVSGGHTEILLVENIGAYKRIGGTRDDAAGEAFDKVAKMLGLGYPGGPEIARVAKKGDAAAMAFPRAMKDNPYDMSFSGLKTAVRYELDDHKARLADERYIADVAASFQEAVVDTLVTKTFRAMEDYHIATLLLAGGVAANIRLRQALETRATQEGIHFLPPDLQYCTDNAVMIGVAALLRDNNVRAWKSVKADARWELGV